MHANYIVVESSGLEIPIVFPAEMDHQVLGSVGRIVSAGWCSPNDGWRAFGECQSLHVPARVERDTLLLRVYFGDINAAAGDAAAASETHTGAVSSGRGVPRADGDHLIA